MELGFRGLGFRVQGLGFVLLNSFLPSARIWGLGPLRFRTSESWTGAISVIILIIIIVMITIVIVITIIVVINVIFIISIIVAISIAVAVVIIVIGALTAILLSYYHSLP